MANTQSPYGFRHVSNLTGAAQNFGNGSGLVAAGYGTQLFFGDPVTRLNTGYLAKSVPGTTQIHGIFIGCEYLSTSRGYKWRSNWFNPGDAAADVTAWVIAYPDSVFQVQTGNSATTAAAATLSLVGNNINFAVGPGGNTATGISSAYADLSTAATTSTLPFRVLGLVSDPPSVNGADTTTAFNDILVAFNWQDYKSTTGI